MSDDESRLASRKNQFKATTDADEIRRKREDDEFQIRKKEKADLLKEKRAKVGGGGGANDTVNDATTQGGNGLVSSQQLGQGANIQAPNQGGPAANGNTNSNSNNTVSSSIYFDIHPDSNPQDLLPQLSAAIFNDSEPAKQLEAVTIVRKLLSKEDAPPIEAVVNAELTPKLVQLMTQSDADPRLILETSWAVTNIASGENSYTNKVVEAGGVDAFLHILNSEMALRQELCEQSVWGLGNIAGDGPKFRDLLLSKDVMRILQNICTSMMELPWNEVEKESNLKNILWVMTNLCRGSPPPAFSQIEIALKVFAEVIGRGMKDSLLNEALWGIFYSINSTKCPNDSKIRLDALLLNGQTDNQPQGVVVSAANVLVQCLVQAVEPKFEPKYNINIETGEVSYTGQYQLSVLEAREHSYTKDIRIPALKALGELISAEARYYTDVCILSGVIPAVLKMLKFCRYAQARKEGCWLVSNLLASHSDQVMASIAPYDLSVNSSTNDILTYDRLAISHPEVYSHYEQQATFKTVMAAYESGRLPRAGGVPAENPVINGVTLSTVPNSTTLNLPQAQPEFESVFDVLELLVDHLTQESNAKFKSEILKEVCYCLTNYCTTNDIREIEQNYIRWLTPTTNETGVEQSQTVLIDLFKVLLAHAFPLYELKRYYRIPASFMLLTTVYLENSQNRPVEVPLITQTVEAAQKLLQMDFELLQAGQGLPDESGQVKSLQSKCAEIGFVEQFDNTILKLQSSKSNTSNVKDCLKKCEAFRVAFFPDDDGSVFIDEPSGGGGGFNFGNGNSSGGGFNFGGNGENGGGM